MNIKKLSNNQLVTLCAQKPEDRTAWSEFYCRFDERIWLVILRECQQIGLFETSIQAQQIVQDLESGELPLETALKKFEEGMKVARTCTVRLDEIEQKVTMLLQDKDGRTTEKPFTVDNDSMNSID